MTRQHTFQRALSVEQAEPRRALEGRDRARKPHTGRSNQTASVRRGGFLLA